MNYVKLENTVMQQQKRKQIL